MGLVVFGDVRRQRLQDRPLRWAGVLRLVQQNVSDAAVELPQHPFGGVAAGEQSACAVDQVVEIKAGASLLALREIGEHHIGKPQHRR